MVERIREIFNNEASAINNIPVTDCFDGEAYRNNIPSCS